MTCPAEHCSEHPGNTSGFALIIVIAFLLIFASFLGVFATSAHIKALTGATRLSDFRLKTTALAIAELIDVKIAESLTAGKPALFGIAHCHIGNSDVDIGIQPQSGLIDLNLASEETLATGFAALGLNRDVQRSLAKAVTEFRYPGGLSNDPTLLPLRGDYKHARFEDIAELADFKPIEDVPLWKLAHVFSVYGSGADPLPSTLAPILRGTSAVSQPHGASGLVGTAFTVEATVTDGARRFYVGHVVDIGPTGSTQLVASIPWDHLSVPPQGPDDAGLCTNVFDANSKAMLSEVM